MHESKIIDIIDETHDTKSIRFERPKNFEYQPGQYCIFEHKMGTELIRRSYSLSSSPTEDFLQVTVKHVFKGKMSTYLTDLKKGETLSYNGPVGKFVFEDDIKNAVFVAGGSGISPFRSMLKYIMDKNLGTEIIVIYGSRSPKDIIMKEELEKFNKEDYVKLYLTVDRADEDWSFHTGFVDLDFIKEATGNKLKDKYYFLIGPPPMVTSIKDTLLSAGLTEEKVLMDAWG